MRLIFTFLFCVFFSNSFSQKQKVWLDADTGNEMDDVWAVVRLLYEHKNYDIVGFSSAHFNNADLLFFEKWNQYATKGIQPVELSQQLNEEILKAMNLSQIPHPKGADRQMGRAWGEFHPRKSEATDALLKEIQTLKANEKLDILTLGAITNIASLIKIDPTVIKKIRVYSLGGKFSFEKNIWDKNEFNVRCDLNAFDFMLNTPNLDWTILSTGVIYPYTYNRDEIYEKFEDTEPAEWQMEKRWKETNPNDLKRVLWDLGLVQLYLKPQMAQVVKVLTPKENHQHYVKMYKVKDFMALYDDFWDSVKKNKTKK
jgi:purine nucleosidase